MRGELPRPGSSISKKSSPRAFLEKSAADWELVGGGKKKEQPFDSHRAHRSSETLKREGKGFLFSSLLERKMRSILSSIPPRKSGALVGREASPSFSVKVPEAEEGKGPRQCWGRVGGRGAIYFL